MKRYIIQTIIFALFCLDGFAQSFNVKGVVTEESGEPVMGVMVGEKETSNGTVTDGKGEFSINLRGSAADAVLFFNMLGYAPQEVKVNNQTHINVRLESTSEMLEDVVIVGYGTQTKVSVTGSISSIDNTDLKKSPTVNVVNSLTGRIAGVTTQQTSGRPGQDDADIFIRGNASLSGNNAPLVLVDGVERAFAQVDPDDIETISVLKDASATAVYGVRGANGVILVTTKRGRTGKTQISFTSEFGFQKLMRFPDKVDSWEHAILKNEGAVNDDIQPMFTEEDIAMYYSGVNPFTHPNVDYLKTFFKVAPQQKYNLNLSGGTDRVRYYVSVGYVNQKGIFETDINKLLKKGSFRELVDYNPDLPNLVSIPDYDASHNFDRFNVRSNLDIDVSKNFKIGIDLGYRNEISNNPGGSSYEADAEIFGAFARAPNAIPLYNENGTYCMVPEIGVIAPFLNTTHKGYSKRYKNALEATLKLKYDFESVEGLTLDGKFSVNSYSQSRRYINNTAAIWSYDRNTGIYTQQRNAVAPTAGYSVSPASRRLYGEISLGYRRSFGDHHVSGLLLANVNADKNSDAASARYSNIPQIYQGIVGRANYDYKRKYLAEINFGYNGSNRFDKGKRYAVFPAGSIGWVVSNEPFMEGISDILSYFKIRASAGQVGNDKIGSGKFEYYNEALFEAGYTYNFGLTPTNFNGLRQGLDINSFVTWEKATKYNLGIETKWLKNRLEVNADFFYEKRTDLLASPGRYLYSSGAYKFPRLNIGKVENKGLELEMRWSDKIGEVGYFIQGIYSFARNEIIEQNEQVREYSYMNRTGHRINQNFGYIADGLFQSYEQIASSPSQFGQLQPGDVKYRDLNGDGVIDDRDITAYGYSRVPEITYSATFGFDYKGFAISAMFQGATNVTFSYGAEVEWEFYNNATAMKDKHLDRWTPETAATAKYHRLAYSSSSNDNNFKGSSFYARDASYIRLKNLELSYSMPKKWFAKTPLANIKVYASGYNLWTWDKVKVVDPESRSGNQYFYPQTKIYNMGINITF